MTSTSQYEGGCLCGHIRFRAQGPVRAPHTCSCRQCQRHSGALTQTWVEFERDQLAWTGPGGLPATWRSSERSSRTFCPQCGSTLGAIDDAPTLAIAVGVFDNPDQPELAPRDHSYRDRQPSWWPDCLMQRDA